MFSTRSVATRGLADENTLLLTEAIRPLSDLPPYLLHILIQNPSQAFRKTPCEEIRF
jgi:hypothetical protein